MFLTRLLVLVFVSQPGVERTHSLYFNDCRVCQGAKELRSQGAADAIICDGTHGRPVGGYLSAGAKLR